MRSAILSFSLLIVPPSALADSEQMDTTAKDILRVNLDLQSLVEQYHLAAALWNYNRGKRVWFYDFFNGVSTEGGLIDAVALNFSHSNDQTVKQIQSVTTLHGTEIIETEKKVRAHIPRSKVAGTLYSQIAGQLVGGGGALAEIGVDTRHHFKLRSENYLRKQITHRVADKVKELNLMISQFDQQSEHELNGELYKAESSVLKGMVRNSVAEFLRLERRATVMSAANIIDDELGFLRNAVGGVGNSLNLAAAFKSDKRLNGQGAICNLIAASMIITRPIFTTVGSELMAKRSKHTRELLNNLTSGSFEDTCDEAHITLQNSINSLSTIGTKYDDHRFALRSDLYKRELQQYDNQRALAQSEQKQWNHVVARRVRETLYGPTKATQASISIVANFRKSTNTTSDARLGAAGNTTYASGQLLNLIELVRERVIDNKDHERDKNSGRLPEQQIARSLENISAMQQSLR